MNVILKTDVEKLGKFGEVVKVAEGYARNYLIPKGYAATATPGNIKQLESEKEAFVKKALDRKAKAETKKTEVEKLTLSFTRKAAEGDKLFGSVTVHDVEEALKAAGLKLEKKDVHLAEAIKNAGEFTVEVKLHPEVIAKVKIVVDKE